MSRDHTTYYALRPFPHKGRVHQPGAPIAMHPKQAKYLLGTHLSADKPAKSSKTQGDQ